MLATFSVIKFWEMWVPPVNQLFVVLPPQFYAHALTKNQAHCFFQLVQRNRIKIMPVLRRSDTDTERGKEEVRYVHNLQPVSPNSSASPRLSASPKVFDCHKTLLYSRHLHTLRILAFLGLACCYRDLSLSMQPHRRILALRLKKRPPGLAFARINS